MQASVLEFEPRTHNPTASPPVHDDTARLSRATAGIEPALGALLDELDYGMVLLGDGAGVVYVNQAGRQMLRDGHCLAVVNGALRTRCNMDAQPLADALAAARRGLRRLITLGSEETRAAVSLIPIGAPLPDMPALIAAVFGRRRLCEPMSVQWFARSHDLTPKETHVLELLCDGLDPSDIATLHDVSITTVRTQVISIRQKTGTASLRALMQRMATLPPMVSSLRF